MTNMTNLNLSGLMNAVRNRTNANWLVGDELIKLCGPASDNTAHDGSREIYQLALTEIEAEGHDGYSISHLAHLRLVSTKFPSVARATQLPWSIHRVAGTPEMLEQIIRIASLRKQNITKQYAADLRKEIEKDKPPTEEQIQEEMDSWLDPMLKISTHFKEVTEKFDTRWNIYLNAERMNYLLEVLKQTKDGAEKLFSIIGKAVEATNGH